MVQTKLTSLQHFKTLFNSLSVCSEKNVFFYFYLLTTDNNLNFGASFTFHTIGCSHSISCNRKDKSFPIPCKCDHRAYNNHNN